MQLAQAGENLKALREIADVLIGEAKAGNIQAIREIADRLDGKPAQMLESAVPSNLPPRKLTYEIVHVMETREQNENGDLVVDYQEVKAIDGNGRGNTDDENKAVNGNGHPDHSG